MKIKVYQINFDLECDNKHVKFMNYDSTIKIAGRIDPSIYECVYDGDINADTLESVYTICNGASEESRTIVSNCYAGHSLSVSDIVEVINGPVEAGCYFCDTFGFRKLASFPTQNIDYHDRLKLRLAFKELRNRSTVTCELPTEVCEIIYDAVVDSFDVGHPSFDLWDSISEDLEGLKYDEEVAKRYFHELVHEGPRGIGDYHIRAERLDLEGDLNAY